jgi:outer membrane protein assembly factor BamB
MMILPRVLVLYFGFLACVSFNTVGTYAQEKGVNDGISVAPTDWPWWRGPSRNGVASSQQTPPETWSETENILWKTPIPGRGYGSPIVFGEYVVLETCEESTGAQSVLAVDRKTGKPLWDRTVHPKGGMRKNEKSTGASGTPAWDGERIFVNFANSGSVYVTCLDLAGSPLWQKEISKYVEHQGYGSSPAIYQSLVIVNTDNKGGGAIVALDRKSGQEVWRRERPVMPNYPSPTILSIAGNDQLLMTGCELVSSFEPLTGRTLWETKGATTECVTTTVTDGLRIFTSGGYPKNHISAVRADGSNKMDWENKDRVYVPSLLCKDGYLFGVLDAGVAACWKSDTGEEKWKGRLGGTFSSSLVLVGDKIYATNEAGMTFLFRANPDRFELLGSNQLGTEVLATPVIVGGHIYYRASLPDAGRRQEYLFCIGNVGR